MRRRILRALSAQRRRLVEASFLRRLSWMERASAWLLTRALRVAL